MEVIRIAIAFGFFIFAGLAFFFFTDAPDGLSVSDATLQKMGNGFALEASINNPGDADVLTGVGTEFAAQAVLTNSEHTEFPIPSGSNPKLAMDGLHAMITGPHGSTEPGRLVPVTLWFKNAGPVTTRARISDAAPMRHGDLLKVGDDQPKPSVVISATQVNDGWAVTLETENFTFSRDQVDGPHVPGIGHAHLYLNGLKLQRIYSGQAELGELAQGTHVLSVSLNTNDHTSYFADGRIVADRIVISVE